MSLMASFLWAYAKESGSPRAWGAGKEAALRAHGALAPRFPVS